MLLKRLVPLQPVTRCRQGTGTERERREKRMLIGISIRSVMSKRSCALDENPSCERVLSLEEAMKASGKTFKTLDSVDSEI